MFCYGSMDLMAARVICRETSGMFAARMRRGTDRSHVGTNYIGNVKCTGDEMSVAECDVQVVTAPTCPNGHIVVDCTPGVLSPLHVHAVLTIPAERCSILMLHSSFDNNVICYYSSLLITRVLFFTTTLLWD